MATYRWNPEHKYLYTADAEGKYHSYDDLPAIETYDSPGGTYIWMTHGQLDRDCTKGPAFIHYHKATASISKDTTYKYFKMGKLHNHTTGGNNSDAYNYKRLFDIGSNNNHKINKKIYGKDATLELQIQDKHNYTINNEYIENTNKIVVYKLDDKKIFINYETGETIKTLKLEDVITLYVYKNLSFCLPSEYLGYQFNCGCKYTKDNVYQLYQTINYEFKYTKIYCDNCKIIAGDVIFMKVDE